MQEELVKVKGRGMFAARESGSSPKGILWLTIRHAKMSYKHRRQRCQWELSASTLSSHAVNIANLSSPLSTAQGHHC